jgi:dTDP-4-dehydrorhamnose 3,5-epimerase-like enzyme
MLSGLEDGRGLSLFLDDYVKEFLGAVRNCHVATILPNECRGNHLHREKREIIVVLPSTEWTLHWDEGENTEIRSQEFSGVSPIVVEICPGASHAITNRGKQALCIIALGDRFFDPERPDVEVRIVTKS